MTDMVIHGTIKLLAYDLRLLLVINSSSYEESINIYVNSVVTLSKAWILVDFLNLGEHYQEKDPEEKQGQVFDYVYQVG